MVTYVSLKTKEKSSLVIPKVVAVAYGSGRLQELFITKFKAQFKWGFAKVVATRGVAYKSGRKESFNCSCNPATFNSTLWTVISQFVC